MKRFEILCPECGDEFPVDGQSVEGGAWKVDGDLITCPTCGRKWTRPQIDIIENLAAEARDDMERESGL